MASFNRFVVSKFLGAQQSFRYGLIKRSCLSSRLPSTVICSANCSTETRARANADMKQFWVKNETVKRPLSPHLTIWKWQLPMNTSLMHRISGSMMTGTLYIFAYTICVLPGDYVTYLNVIKDMHFGPTLITAFKFILSFPLAYHALNAGRHLSWDMGSGFDLSTIYKTGWFVIFGAAVLSGLMTQL